MKNFNFANLISKLCSSVHSIFNTTNVEFFPLAIFKSSTFSKKIHLQKVDCQLKQVASRSFILTAMLVLISNVSWGQSAGFNNTFIVLSLNGGANTFYDLNAVTANTDFNTANLGTFPAGSSNLILKGAEHNVFKCGGADLTSTRLNYRIYPTASPSGSYTSQNIVFTSSFGNGCGGQDQLWSNTGLTTNLLTGLGTGSYTIEVYSDATITCCGGTAFASNAGNNYKATFTVSSIVWTNGATATAWYTNTNWTPNTTSAQWLTGSVAEFQNSGTATTAGINMTTASLSIGQIDVTAVRTRTLTIGNSVTTIGSLTLNGATAGSNANVILRNSSGSLFTLQNNETGTGKTMNIALGNATTNTIDAAGIGGITISSAISGVSRSITKIGSGTLTLSGTNTYSGGTIISGGTVSAGAAANLGDAAGAITLGSGATSATLAANVTFTRNALNVTTSSTAGVIDVASSQTLTLAALNTASGTDNTTKFGKSGAGTLRLPGVGSYVGQTQIGQGTVIVSNNAGLGTNNSTVARGIDLGLNVGDVSQPNNVSVLATTTTTVPQSIYVAPNTTGATRTVGVSGSGTATFSNEIFMDGSLTALAGASNTLILGGRLTSNGGLIVSTGITFLTASNNNYTGTTSINTDGELRLQPSANASFTSQVILNAGTLSTAGITATRTWTNSSTLNLNANSIINLGFNAHTITFANSSGVTWAGTTLTINGWTGTGGASGTAGKIFFGSATGTLTGAQLAKITFTGFPGTPILLSTGELVPAAPSIAISGVDPGASSVTVGTTNVILHQYNLAVTLLSATLTGLNVTTAGTYATADITNLKVRYSTDAVLDGADATLSTLTSPGTAGLLTFPTFTSQAISSGTTGYIFITADVAVGATGGNTINIASNAFTNFTFSSGSKTGTDPVTAAGVKTFSSLVPSIAISNSAPASSNQNAGSTNVVLQRLDLAVTVTGTSLTGLTVTTAGTYASADITNLKVRYSTDATLDGGDATLSTFTTPGVAGSKVFPSFTTQALSSGATYYLFITADIATTATGGNTISLGTTTFSNISLSAGTKTGTDPVAASNTVTIVNPAIAVSSNTPAASTHIQGSTDIVLNRFDFAVTSSNATLTGVTVTTAGTYISADVLNLKVRYSTDATLDGGDATLSTFTTPGIAGSKVFPSFVSQSISSGTTGYIFITADISSTATPNNTISLGSTAFSNLTFSLGNLTGTNPVAAGNTRTFIKAEPTNYPTSFACGTTTSSTIPLTWADASTGILPDGYLIRWSATSYAAIADPVDGTAIANGATAQNVAQGVQSHTATGLTGATTYFFKIWSYTNSGTNINYKLVSEPQTSCATLIAPVTIVTFPSSWVGITTTAPSTSQDANINGTVTATRGAGLVASSSGTRFSSSDWPTSGTLTLASNTDYITFTVNAAVGYLLNLNNAALNFTLSSTGTGPTSYGVYSSVGGFASTAAQIGANLTNSSTSVTFPSSGYNGLSTIEIRIYGWGASGTAGTGGFGSMNLTGNLVSLGTITTGTVSTSLCAGATGVSVPFTYTPSVNFPSGTATFTAQLSNAAGSFASPVTLQSVTSNGLGSQSISATIPALTTTGTGYRIRVVSASPGVNGSDNASNISISNTATSIAPSTTQNISTSTNGTTLTVTEGTTATSRVWKYGTVSGVYGTSTGITTSTYTPNFVLPGTYYIVCVTTYPAPCSNVVTSNEVQVNVVGSVDYTWNGSVSSDWSNSSNWTPNGVPIIDDNVTINVPGTNTLIVTDARSINNLTVSGTGTFQLTSSGALSVYASVTNSIAGSPTFNCASTFSMLSASSQTIPSWNFGNLIASGGARVLSSSGTIGICGTFTPGAGAYTNTGSTVNFNGTGTQTVNAINYNNLSISGAHTTNSITLLAGTIGIAGTFSPTATFSSGTYVNTGNTIDCNGTGAQTVAAFSSYNNLTISGARASALVTLASGTIGVEGTFNPSATTVTYTSTGNTFNYSSAGSQTIAVFSQYNNLSNSGNGARTLANGIIAIYGTYTPTTAAITVGTSTVDFAGAAGQTIPASFYYNITNSSNTNRTWANAGIIDIKNTFTPTSATNTITGSTVQYSATSGTLNLTTFTTNIASRNYNNLIINGTGGSWNLNANTIGVANDLTVSAGTLIIGVAAGAGTLNVDGIFTVNGGTVNTTNSNTNAGTLNLFGNLTVSSGTFSKSGSGLGTVNLIKSTGTQTFTGGGTISNANAWNFGNGTTANTIQIASNVSASTGVFNVNTGTTVDFGTNTLTVTSGAFNLNSGATLNTTNASGITTAGATGSILRSSGSNTFSASANYIFGGAITGTGFTGANNLTINNASGVTLSAAAIVNGALTFTNGLLDIAAVNLTIGSTGSIAGANTAKYVKTSGAGQLKMTVAASNVLFPVGRSAFNPLTLNNSGTSDVFGVVLADAISQALNNSSLVVNRSWNITETSAGGSNLSIVNQWNGAVEQAAGFAGGTTPRIAYWNGSAWIQTGATQAGANPFTFTSTASLSGIASATYSIAIGKDDAFICTAAPTVSLVLPTSGYSGDVITINGSGLSGLTGATIGGTAATIVSQFGTSATLTVGAGATGVITVSKSPVCSASSASSFTFLGFVSAQTGNWNLGSTWQGGVVPPSGSGVTILNSHNVTLNVNSAPSGVTINSGGTLTLNNATNTLDLGAGTLLVNGTLSVTSAVNAASARLTAGTLTIGTGGAFTNSAGNAGSISVTTFNVNSGATYNHDALGSSPSGTLSDFPGLTGGANISINSNASVNITKWAQNTGTPTTLPSVSGGQWGNLTINISGLTYSGSWQNSGILTNATSLNVVNTGSKDFRLVTPTGTAGFTCTIGSVNVSGGIFIFIGGGSIGSGVVTMNVTNDFNVSGGVASIHGTPNSSTSYNTTGVTLNVGGNLNITGGSFYGHANAQTNTVAVSSSSTTLNVTGNLSINNGTLDLAFLPNYNIAGNTGNVNLNVKGNLTLGTTGILRNSNSIAPLGKTTATVNFNHASAQQTWTQTGTIQYVIGFNVNGSANTLQLLSNANIGSSSTSSFNVANATTFDMQAFVLGGSGAFTSAAGSTLKIGNADGITTIPTLSGNVQLTASRTFNAATSYTYTGSVNQVTGNGLPSITTGALSIANTGAASNNTVSLTTNGTTATTFNLTSGLFAAGAAQQLNIASGGTVNATSGGFETGANAGILNFPGIGTFTGNSNPYNVYASGGVNFGAGTVTIQPNGTFRINSGGFVNTNAPFYASGSTLQYNTTGVYGRNIEWRASSGRGYPHHVQVSNSTTLNPGANSNTGQPFNAGGNLTIDAGSNIYMDFGGLNMSVPLTVTGGLNLNGNLSLSGSIGGDINVGGDWTNNGTASNFFANSRAVTFNGSVNQNIGGSNTSSNPFAFVTINNAAGGTLTFGQSVSNTLTFSAGNLSLGIYDLTISPGASISGASSSKFIITNSSGKLVQNLVNNSTSKTYPIGANSSAYTPAILSQTASGVTDNIGVRVSSAPAFDNAVNDNTQMIGVQWTINESVAGGNNLVTSFQWPQAIEGASFVRANGVFHGNWTGSNYVVRPTSASSGSDPYTSASTVNYTSTLSNQPFVLGNINGVLGCFSSTASGSWNSNSTWSSGIVPVSGVSVCLNHNITIGSADPNPDAVLGVTLNGSSTLDIHSSKTLTFSNGGALINNSGLAQNIGAGTVLSSGVLAISGANSITMSHLTLNGNTTITTAPSISGNLTLNSGAFLTAAPIYGSASTLIYNTGGLYTVSNEWTGNSTAPGLGIPNNVTVNGSFLTMPGSSRGLSGNLSISAGSLDLNSISGDLYIAGNWNRNIGASFNANNRAVFFNGAANQTITVTGGDAETFAYLVLDKSAGNLIIDNTQPSDVAINGDFGNVLQINAGNTFDLNGRNLSLVGTGGNVNLPSGSSTITGPAGSNFIIWNGAKTVTPSLGATLNFDSNVTVVLNNGFNFGATTSTINGTLQIANGGFVSTNSPSYAIGSTLRYFTGSNFNRGLEWSTNSGPGYPHHVVLDLNSTVTTVNLAPGSATCQVAGNLTVNNGAILNMGAMANPLVVLGNVTVGGASSGTLSLSSVAGGDIKIGGNLTRNSGGLLTQNGREVEMNGSVLQTITGVTTFDFLAVNNSASSVRLTDNSTINNRLRLSNGQFDLNGLTCTLTNGSKILRVNGTMSASPTVTGINVYDLEYQNSVTSSFEYLASSTAVRDLIITTGNTLTLGDNRTFNRDLTLSGGDLNLGGYTLTARGRATAPSFSGSITVSGGGARTITGPAGSTFDITGLGSNLPNDYTKTVSTFNSSTLTFDSNVLVRIGDGAVDFGSGSPTTINGTLQVLLAGSVGQILNPCYYGVNSLLRFSNTVDYQVGSNDKTWASGAIASGNPGIPYNVEVMDANTDLQLQSTRALRGNLTITDGTFTLTPAYSGSFNIGGNWTRSGATSAFNHNSKKVVFDRQTAGSQTITLSSGISTETFYDLEVSLFSGNLVTAASSSLTISNNLNFVSGKIDLGANRLTIGTGLANGTITGANSSKYVITNAVAGGGNIKAFTNSNTAYVFPVGDATNYSPMSVTLTNGAQVGSYISTTAVQGIHPNLLTGAPPTKYISRYWSVVPSGLTIDPVYDVSFSYVVADEVGIGTLYPIKYSTETTTPGWLSCPGSTAAAVTGTSGANDNVLKTFTWAGLTTFSDFSGAGDGSPLPVTWLNFDAQFNNTTNNVDVSWTTASEINNDYFEVMRSVDAVNFEVVGTVDGAGNSSLVKDYAFVDTNPLTGLSYYKIRQVDFNGQSDNTEILAVSNLGGIATGTLFTYPNPLIGQDLTIVYSNLDKGNWDYRLVDITGKIVLAQNRTSDLNAGAFTLNLEQLPAGIYLFQLNTQSQNFTRKITISK